ncbi:Site-specific recombinase XerD [Serratia fonticola]|uniref:hypothetical protein n=1 Tax=Serratia fonticola TaxID=47917 RepID=UPI002183164E|nr:hypothetical protein [Serratia fonticola]CAI2116771.1 Site-specific recombinase XerD [Serratia fonticola]
MNKIDEEFEKLVTLEHDGSYKIKRLTPIEINNIPDFIVYSSDFINEQYNFKGNKFRPNKNENRLSIKTHPVFEFEIKIILILIAKRGTKIGGIAKRFSTCTRIIRGLIQFAEFIYARDYESFHDLGSLNELKFNNIVSDYVNYRGKQGESTVGLVKDVLATLYELNFLNKSFSQKIIELNTKVRRTKSDTVNRLKHPLVPPEIHKKTISECIQFFKGNNKEIIQFTFLGNKVNSNLEIYASKKPNARQSIHKILSRTLSEDEAKEYSRLRSKIERINPYAFTLLLSLTGFRVSEAKAVRNNAHKQKSEDGRTKYFIESTLRKYTNEDVVLEWVSCKPVYDVMELLSNINNIFFERMNLILQYYPSKITNRYSASYKEAINNKHMFSFNLSSKKGNLWVPQPTLPTNIDTSGRDITTVSLDLIEIKTTEHDIDFLKKYKCNYKSVNAGSGVRGEKYKPGDIFRITPHMLRHTFAWFIVANKLGDIHHISQQFKHTNEMVTIVYAQRGFEAIDEFKNIIDRFDSLLTEEVISDIVESAIKGEISGGGGKRLKNLVERLNKGQPEIIFSTDHQEHIESIQALIAFATRNSDGILGLPHGYCTSGASCKMHGVAAPHSCIYCDTYFATRRHLPFWVAAKNSAERGINRIINSGATDRYQAFLNALNRTLDAAKKAIFDINGAGKKGVSNG